LQPLHEDIVVYSDSWNDHLKHIRVVLGRLREAGLTASPKKCYWGESTIEFLGHSVGGCRMALPTHRAEALSQYTRPTTKKGLRAFLGSIGFYRRYVLRLASQTAILTPHTSKTAPSKVVWTEEGERAFMSICANISECCSLCVPLPGDVFSIVSDASGLGIGGVLKVWRDDQWEAAAFFSRQLRGAEQRYNGTALCLLPLWQEFQGIH